MAESEKNSDEDDSSGSGSEWEEVVNTEYQELLFGMDKPPSVGNDSKTEEELRKKELSGIPENGLQIVVPGLMGIRKKGKNKENIIANYLIREMNKCKKELYIDLHRVSLLLLLARGLLYNRVLNSEEILCIALSTLPSERSRPPKNLDLGYLEKFVKWYKSQFKVISVASQEAPVPATLTEVLISQLSDRKVKNHAFHVFIFVAILRSLGVQVRFVWNFIPLPLKPGSSDLMKLLSEDPDKPMKSRKPKKSPPPPKEPAKPKGKPKSALAYFRGNGPAKKSTKRPVKLKHSWNWSSEDSDVEHEPEPGPSNGRNRSRAGGQETPGSTKQTKDKHVSPKKGTAKATGKKKVDSDSYDDGSDDSEFEPERKAKNKSQNTSTKTSQKSSNAYKNIGKKFVSSSSDEEVANLSTQKSKTEEVFDFNLMYVFNYWAEVYLEEEERWVSVDLTDGKVLCDSIFEGKATKPMCYVIAFANDGTVKDVTRRYASLWLTATQKDRDSDWWTNTLKPYRGRRTERDRAEDEFMDQHLLSMPIPKSLTEIKNHPLFAMSRHLLKFEALYPPDANPCGFYRKEPVYPRSCVHTLHSRDMWFRKAKVVRLDEKPYKIVKGRAKTNRVTGVKMGDQALDLFGEWQVEDYQCPIAQDGKVPRDQYGSVPLFMEKMLPIGTVHLRNPGLNRVAKKLDIDCANAIVGFDFHAGGSHPTLDGFVVCEEFKDILLDAWNEEQAEIEKKEKEKRQQRVIKNWERLCKGLLIKQRLETRYKYNLSGKRKQAPAAQDSTSRKRKR